MPIRLEKGFEFRSSGVSWYREGAGPFLQLEVPAAAGTASHTLEVSTPAQAAALLGEVMRQLAQPTPGPVAIGSNAVLPTPALERVLRETLATYNARTPGTEDSAPEETDEPAQRPARLGALLREADEAAPSDGRPFDIDLEAVPWSQLETLLLPGIALKEHQREGLAWLWQHARLEAPGVLLADDMGLGKTLQIACFLALRRHVEPKSSLPMLICCPVILIDNWIEELRRFFRPGVFDPLLRLHGDGTRRLRKGTATDTGRIAEHATVLTNYETLAGNQRPLLAVDWDTVVLDEGQQIKNPDTGRAVAARGLKKRFGICATGTPVENRLSDLWSLYDFLSPGRPFTTFRRFREEHDNDPEMGVERVRLALAYGLASRTTCASVLPALSSFSSTFVTP